MDKELLNEIIRLFDMPQKLNEMRSAMKSLSKPDAAQQIGNLIIQQSSVDSQKGGHV